MKKRLKRQEIPIEKTWKTEDLYMSKEAFLMALEDAKKKARLLLEYKGCLLESPQTLLEAIEKMESLYVELNLLDTYTELNQAVDATDTENQELSMVFGAASTQIQTTVAFFENELMAISDDQYTNFFKEEPKLEEYRTYIEDLYKKKKYKLSDATEEALAALGEVTKAPYTIYSISKAADMVFDDFEDGSGQMQPNSFALFEGKYEYSEDSLTRKNAYVSFNKTLNQYKNTYATVYNTEVKKQVAMSRLRGYASVTDMLLQTQKVTEAMYNRQIDIIYKELSPHMRKYAGVIKEVLKLDKVNFYDLKAPIDTSYNPPATFEEAKEVVLASLEIMGADYVEIMKHAFDERWIDYGDNIGKGTGAFCASPYGVHPYIFMTFQDNMRDAFTLTHELGHAGHFYLSNKEQKPFNAESSMYTIEAPSTMNEILLGRYLLDKYDDPKMKKWVLLQFMGTYYHNFVTHLLEAVYQRNVYAYAEAGRPLTAQLLTQTKLEVLKGFWADAVAIDDDAGLTWMRQPHYYMGLYPYTYSVGLTASTTVAEMIFQEGQVAVDRWLEMLRSGGKLKPLALLKVAGMDFSTDQPVQNAVAYVGSLIDQLTELCQ